MHYHNIHTHAPVLLPAVDEIESIWYGQAKIPVAARRSVGLHPWYLPGMDLRAAEDWLNTAAAQPDVVAIGEAGLDKITKTPWDLQVRAFELCLRVAWDTGKPIIIHCVRAYNEVLQCLRNVPGIQAVFHGYDKNAQIAATLIKQDCYLSFGAALFHERSHATEVLRQLPADRFFLETDDAAISITAVYERAAAIRNVSTAAIETSVAQNVKQVFGY